jgi:hypothetical protein
MNATIPLCLASVVGVLALSGVIARGVPASAAHK